MVGFKLKNKIRFAGKTAFGGRMKKRMMNASLALSPTSSGVGQGKLYDNAVSGGRISPFQGGDSSILVVFNGSLIISALLITQNRIYDAYDCLVSYVRIIGTCRYSCSTLVIHSQRNR